MKKFIKLNFILLLFVFNLTQVKPQENTNKLSFIKLGTTKGYVLDSLENLRCKCVPNAGTHFQYAALLQLPDSAIVLRIKNDNIEGFIDEKMRENKLTDFYERKLAADAKKSLINFNDEERVLKQFAADSIEYQLIDLKEFKLPDLLQTKTFVYLDLGLGFGIIQNSSAFAYGAELGIIKRKSIFSIRNFGVAGFQQKDNIQNPVESTFDFGLLYGRNINWDKTMITFATGIALNSTKITGKYLYTTGVFFSRKDHYEKVKQQSIGLPIQIGVLFGTHRNSGLSLQAFANLNEKYPFGGVICCLRVGKIKNCDFSIY
jgi:hypothetical protein